jgi:hypothetical protein
MNISEQERRALDALKKDGTLRERALITCEYCGMTNQPLVLLECGEDLDQRLVRATLDWLSNPTAHFPAMLEGTPMRLASRNGRPQQAYLLTEFGKNVLSLLEPPIIARVHNPRDEKDQQHRFAQLHILTLALQNGWEAEVEKVIPYAGGEVRCDVLIHRTNDSDLYIEIEQELSRNNLERAREKFRNWQAYARAREIVPDMIFVFNLPDAKLAHTLHSWQEALGSISEGDDFALDVRYILVKALEGRDMSEAIGSFSVWMEPIIEMDAGHGAASQASSQSAAPEVWLPDAYELLPQFDDLVERYAETEASRDFFELMLFIHQASYGQGSDTFEESRLPVESLWLLRHYLSLPRNQKMYEELKQALIWLKSRGSMGLIMMRDTLCGILWDTFLKRHELAMGGNLRVSLDVPDYVNRNSTFEVKVTFWKEKNDTRSKEYCDALSWVLTAFLWYPEVLGTGTQPWKKASKKMKGKKQNDTNTD